MSRMLTLSLAAMSLCALAHMTPNSATAQVRRPAQPTTRPAAKGQPTKPQAVDPDLMRVLEDWYRGTRQIKTLEGSHSKYTYNEVFAVETRALGKFYYATPDKGRIDIYPAKIVASEKSARYTKGSTRSRFALQQDKAELWICNGKMIARINPLTKKGDRFDIPPKAQGRNIMEGPLPFLLGMPPDVALRRYRLKVLKETEDEVWLQVHPRWAQDLKQYGVAKVVLKKKNFYLPSAVLMVDVTENLETVYTFYKMTPNKKAGLLDPIWGTKDPFEIPAGVKLSPVGGNKAGRVRIAGPPNRPLKRGVNVIRKPIPNLIGLSHADAALVIKKAGFKPKIHKGSVAKTAAQLYRVEDQSPKARVDLEVGQTVHLKLFVKAVDLKPQQRTAAKPR